MKFVRYIVEFVGTLWSFNGVSVPGPPLDNLLIVLSFSVCVHYILTIFEACSVARQRASELANVCVCSVLVPLSAII